MLGQCFAPITLREFHEKQGCLKGSGHDCSLCSLVCGAFLGKLCGKSGGCTQEPLLISCRGCAAAGGSLRAASPGFGCSHIR